LISPFSIQKVQDRLDIVEIIGSFLKLKRRGTNHIGNCPFHNEKSPSFTVSQAKGIYKCFGCSKAGNSITFLQEHEKLSYPEAIRWLAKFYNIELEETVNSPEKIEQQKEEESLRIINNYAQQFFTIQLTETTEGQTIGQSYFEERGFRAETVSKFLLGYCPEDRYALLKDAKNKGYQTDLLIKCGLVASRNNGEYDTYSGRVIFPIQNISGKVIGFGARILKTNDKAPKYINSPENVIYSKSRVLYGLFQSKNEIVKQNECYLVEGYTDVISLVQAGVQNVVSSSGTALTDEQLKLIKRYSKNLTIVYDGDAAGIKAALRGLDKAIEEGLNVQLVLLPDGEDPDSYVQKIGAEKFNEYVAKHKKDIILFRLELTLKEAGFDMAKKGDLINEIAETLSKINKLEEFTKQQDYIKRCAELLKIDENGLVALVNKKIRDKVAKENFSDKQEQQTLESIADETLKHHQNEDTDRLLQKDYLQEKALIRALLEYGHLPHEGEVLTAKYIRHRLTDAEIFEHEKFKNLFVSYMDYLATTGQTPSAEYFTYHEDEALRNTSIEALYAAYELSPNWELKQEISTPTRASIQIIEVENCITHLLIRKLKNQMNEYLEQLKEPNITDNTALTLMIVHRDLKQIEKDLLNGLDIVFVK
jgi:DNA primase